MKAFFKLLGMTTLIVFLVVIGPLLAIWSLNILFPVLAIPYNIYTWAAAGLLSGGFSSTGFRKSVN
jgi:hypothetical protein